MNQVEQAMRDGATKIELDKTDRNPSCNLVRYRMLAFPFRQFVVEQVKAPLQNAIVLANKLLNHKVGEPTKLNTIHPHSHILIDERDWFLAMEDNPGRSDLFRAAWNILIYEIEHDSYYKFRFNRILSRLVDKVNSGEWKFELYKPADDFCWKEFKEKV